MKLPLYFFIIGLTLAGFASAPRVDYTPKLACFFLEALGGAVGLTLPQRGLQLAVSSKSVLTEYYFPDVSIAQVELGRCLMFRLPAAAARDLYRLTVPNQGRRLVLVVDGVPLGARRIDRPFDDGAVLVFAGVANSELPGIAENLLKTSAELQRIVRKS